MAPLKEPGIDKLKTTYHQITQFEAVKEDASPISATCEAVIEDPHILSRNTVKAHLKLYEATFEKDAKEWKFWYGEHHVPVDITDTSIAADAFAARVVSMDDLYHVELEITER